MQDRFNLAFHTQSAPGCRTTERPCNESFSQSRCLPRNTTDPRQAGPQRGDNLGRVKALRKPQAQDQEGPHVAHASGRKGVLSNGRNTLLSQEDRQTCRYRSRRSAICSTVRCRRTSAGATPAAPRAAPIRRATLATRNQPAGRCLEQQNCPYHARAQRHSPTTNSPTNCSRVAQSKLVHRLAHNLIVDAMSFAA